MTINGGCRCGAVRYRIEAEPLFTRHCWCRDCQYISAGAGTVNVFFPSEAVKVEGALADYASKAESGNQMHRHFCAACGTPIFTQSEARQAGDGDLDLERALLGRLRGGPPARAEATRTGKAEGVKMVQAGIHYRRALFGAIRASAPAYLISQVALWLTMRASRPPAASCRSVTV